MKSCVHITIYYRSRLVSREAWIQVKYQNMHLIEQMFPPKNRAMLISWNQERHEKSIFPRSAGKYRLIIRIMSSEHTNLQRINDNAALFRQTCSLTAPHTPWIEASTRQCPYITIPGDMLIGVCNCSDQTGAAVCPCEAH